MGSAPMPSNANGLLLRDGFGQGYQVLYHDTMIVKNGVYLSMNIKHVRY